MLGVLTFAAIITCWNWYPLALSSHKAILLAALFDAQPVYAALVDVVQLQRMLVAGQQMHGGPKRYGVQGWKDGASRGAGNQHHAPQQGQAEISVRKDRLTVIAVDVVL